MRKFSKLTLFSMAFCLVLAVITISAQKKQKQPEVKRVETPRETKVPSPPPAPAPTTKVEPVYKPSTTSNDSSRTRRNDEIPSPSTGRSTAGIDTKRRGKRRTKQKDYKKKKKKRKKKWKYHEYCPIHDIYGQHEHYPNEPDYPENIDYSKTDPKIFLSINDIPITSYKVYLEKDSSKFKVYFERPLNEGFMPLFGAYLMNTPRDLPFISQGWVFYYEPDLDNFFVDFAKFGNVKFERLVLTPIGKTAKKVRKKIKYEGNVIRPVLVEDISYLSSKNIYSFNLNVMPKGTYELMLVNKNGDTVRQSFAIK